MTRRAIPICCGFVAGTFLGFYPLAARPLPHAPLAAAVAAALLFLSALCCRGNFRSRALLLTVGLSLGFGQMLWLRYAKIAPFSALEGETVPVSGVVIRASGSDTVTLTVKGEIGGERGRILLYGGGIAASEGDTVSLEARILPQSDPSLFPDGIYAAGRISRVNSVGRGSGLFYRIRSYSARVSKSILAAVSGDEGELLCASVTGDRSVISDSLSRSLSRGGVSHIASVSGLHVSAAAFAVLWILKKLRLPRPLSAAAAAAFIALFIVFSGMRVSAVRAGIMTLALLLAGLFGRKTDPVNTISVTAALICAVSPCAAADASFQLSFAGVLGAAAVAPAIIKAFKMTSPVLAAMTVSLAVSAMTAPFALLYFNSISVLSPLTNLLALPLFSISLIMGLAYAATGCTMLPLIKLAGLVLKPVTALCAALSGFRGSYLPAGGKLCAAAAFLLMAAVTAIYLFRKNVRGTALFGFGTVCISVFALAVGFSVRRPDSVYIINSGGERAALLTHGSSAVCADLDGSARRKILDLAERNGYDLTAAILFENYSSAKGGYQSLLPADKIYFSPGAAALTSPNGKTATVADGHMTLPDGEITLLDGITVLRRKNGEISAFSGDFRLSMERSDRA